MKVNLACIRDGGGGVRFFDSRGTQQVGKYLKFAIVSRIFRRSTLRTRFSNFLKRTVKQRDFYTCSFADDDSFSKIRRFTYFSL